MFFKSQKAILAVMTFLLFVGCGYHEGVTQEDRKSYLWFTGETKSAVVILDDNERFELEPSHYIDSETGRRRVSGNLIHYQIAPGKHRIVVKKSDQVVVDRVVIIGDGMTKEIQIP